MGTMTSEELKVAMDKHVQWLEGAGGERLDLSGSNLSGSDLSRSNLSGSNLHKSDLSGTCLDPENEPNATVDGFDVDGEYVIGYRTRRAGHIDQYRDGRIYAADWFSTCPDTECHPGLYLWPTLSAAKNFSGDVEFIRVRTKPGDVHRARAKWRCRWFEVLGKVEEGS